MRSVPPPVGRTVPHPRHGAWRRRIAALVVVTLSAACTDATAPTFPSAGPPDALRISTSGFGTGSTDIELVGERLLYTYVPWDHYPGLPIDTVVVTPDAARWAAFWAAAREAGLRSWPRECVDRSVADGGGMSIEIVHDGRRLSVANTNASPGPLGLCLRGATTPQELAFRAAVAALVGQPFPGRVVPATELQHEGRPRGFRVTVRRAPARLDAVTLRGDTLVAARYTFDGTVGRGDSVRVVPTAEAWRAFWEAAERAGLRGWPRECFDFRVADGTTHEIDITVPSGRFLAVAVNAYPQPDGRCVRLADAGVQPGASAALDSVLAAVGRLVGRPFP